MWVKWLEECRTVEELQTRLGLSSKTSALQWIKENIPPESDFQDRILSYLKKTFPKAMSWKQANGIYSSMNGLPDIAMVLDSKYYAFEVKRPFIGKLSEIQKSTIAKLKKAGAKVYVVTYVSEVEKIIKTLNLI